MWKRLREGLSHRAFGLNRPPGASDWRPSLIASLAGNPGSQQPFDLNWILKAVATASAIRIEEMPGLIDSFYYNIFPGEHYRLLVGILQQLQPQLIIDIGTFTGMSARVICNNPSSMACIHSFDLIPWTNFASHLNIADFEANRFQQHLESFADPIVFEHFFYLLNRAILIVCDAPKDGLFEPNSLALFAAASLSSLFRWLLLDDIRFIQMVNCWRSIAFLKPDLTAFGHWGCTGLVDISQGLKYNEG
jgi:hypothetical protein